MKSDNKKSVRLPDHIVPKEYDITLKPDLKNFTFEGSEYIYIDIEKPTKTITLHSKEIDIETVHIDINKEKVFTNKISYDQKNDTATFYFPKTINKGKHKLHIVFKGILNDKMRGFYSSKYLLHEKEHHLATTQFESTDARRAFPCFDEPAKKAIFTVSLVVPKGKTAISNTLPVSVEEHESGFEVIRFAPTPLMSTYLLAFIVGDFEFIESKSKRNVKVRIFTTPGKLHQAKFALECAIKTLEFYEEYFDIHYPLNTLDMIAIPDFQAGAMENWGAITYRENAILVDETHSSTMNKQWVALVIAHEIAHQWFGNLVTMEWWTHLWLNEGFAEYIEFMAVDKMFPHWDIWTQFSTHDFGVALQLDGLTNTHPVEITVHHPDEIGEIFDEVSYSKGASIIKMLASYLGEKDFRDGLRYYLKKHSYKNTETIHLWDAFEKISKKPVAKVMRNWTSLPGYPIIKAKEEKGYLSLTQNRFFSSPISRKKNKKKTLWQVPVVLGNEKDKNVLLLTKENEKIESKDGWLKINLGESGFFRVAYSKELLDQLIEPVLNKTLSARDRLGIARDLFALSESGDIQTSEALSFLKAFRNEEDYTVWLEISTGLSKLEQIFHNTKISKSLDSLNIELFSAPFKRLGWDKKENESHTDPMLRSLCISRLGKAGDKKVISEAKKRFNSLKKGKYLEPDLRSAVYKIIASVGSMKEYNYFIERYKQETLHEEKYRIGAGLADFKQDKILSLVAHFAISTDVRTQDTVYLLSALAHNPLGRNVWFKCLKLNWKMFVSKYGDGGHTLARLVKSISNSAEAKHLKSFKTFFKTHEAPGATRAIEQVIEKIESNILWLERDKKSIKRYFN
ncbi:MAG: M1 family metallopeptidase [Patescibacteria group bacterium]